MNRKPVKVTDRNRLLQGAGGDKLAALLALVAAPGLLLAERGRPSSEGRQPDAQDGPGFDQPSVATAPLPGDQIDSARSY